MKTTLANASDLATICTPERYYSPLRQTRQATAAGGDEGLEFLHAVSVARRELNDTPN